jgi:hypothetical protein
MIDTASSYIWVKSPGCSPCHKSDDYFDVGESATYENLKEQIFISYGDANVTGALGKDLVKIGDDETLTVNDQKFIVETEDHGFEEMDADGILGFGLNQLSPNVSTFMENLKASGQIVNSIFSLYLNDNEYDNHNKPEPKSALIIGGVDTDYALNSESQVFNLKADLSSGYWQVSYNSLYMGPEKMNLTVKAAVFDSGKGYISAPEKDAKDLRTWMYKRFEECNYDNQGLIVCDCNNDLSKYPPMYFHLGGNQVFKITPKNYFLKDDKKCLLLVAVDNTLPVWRLGGPFLRMYYSIYDADQGIVSLYPAKVSKDHSHDGEESARLIIIFFVVLLIVICIVMSIFLYLFCCRHKMNFEENYKPLFTAKYNLPPHYHRTAVRTSSGEIVPDYTPTSRQNRVFPGISSK